MFSVSSHQVHPAHEFRLVKGFLANNYEQNGHFQSLLDLEDVDKGLQQVPDGADAILKLSLRDWLAPQNQVAQQSEGPMLPEGMDVVGLEAKGLLERLQESPLVLYVSPLLTLPVFHLEEPILILGIK